MKRKKSKSPLIFGKRPILMMRSNGGLRIIFPNGKVHWTTGFSTCKGRFYDDACTSRDTQKAALNAAVEFDKDCGKYFSVVLGYL